MAQIKHFKSKKDKLKDFLLDLVEKVEKDELDKFCFAGTTKKQNFVLTAFYGCDAGDMQLLNSHIQIDIVDRMIQSNADRYGLHDHY